MKEKIKNTLKNFIEDYMMNYSFVFNTEDVRKEIKKGLDKICGNFLKGGLICYYKNVCDETNNNPYVIDSSVGVTDTYIKFEENDEIIVLTTTLLSTKFINIDSVNVELV